MNFNPSLETTFAVDHGTIPSNQFGYGLYQPVNSK